MLRGMSSESTTPKVWVHSVFVLCLVLDWAGLVWFDLRAGLDWFGLGWVGFFFSVVVVVSVGFVMPFFFFSPVPVFRTYP